MGSAGEVDKDAGQSASTVARTGVRPQPCVTEGAYFFGTVANTQPPGPGC